MFRTINKELTPDQKERGVIYSSAIIVKQFNEKESDTIHEVKADDPNRWEVIDNLKDITFFKNMAKNCGYTAINIIRR